ncbi:MAG: hypothetical protein KBG29_01645 [Pseudomonadales bacterium]|nr:hypothetical protein [Pseudomonadales bacterium]
MSPESFFAAGWRPAAAWICVIALGYQMLLRPLAAWLLGNFTGLSTPPALNDETLMALVFNLLGLGAYRTTEKVKGVAS